MAFRITAVVMANALLVLLALALGDRPQAEFGESGFVTDVHVVVLISAAAFAGLTFRARRAGSVRRRLWAAPELFWLLVAAAFVFLAVDEASRLHEGVDKRFHEYVLGYGPTVLSTRLDDLLVGVYGLGAVALCWRYRAEVLRVPGLAGILVVALAFVFIDMLIDLVNHDDVLRLLKGSLAERQRLDATLVVVEESVKVQTGSLFCLGFWVAWRTASAERSGARRLL
jgi:hypothetical protein